MISPRVDAVPNTLPAPTDVFQSRRLAADRPMGSRGGELAAEASGKKSAAINFCMIHERTLIVGRHAQSQVTNHAPMRPRSTPSSGLDTANQNGIISLKEMVSRVTFAG